MTRDSYKYLMICLREQRKALQDDLWEAFSDAKMMYQVESEGVSAIAINVETGESIDLLDTLLDGNLRKGAAIMRTIRVNQSAQRELWDLRPTLS
jgi:hypothetical protein